MNDNNIFNIIADKAISHYLDIDYKLQYIQHSETITYQVTNSENSQKYLLKIYYPKHVGFIDSQQNDDALLSELEWLYALSEDTDLVLPEPVKNNQGKFLTKIYHADIKKEVNCILLKWVEGKSYLKKEDVNEKTTNNTGVLLAKMHNHSVNWKAPDNFKRPYVNEDLFYSYLANISKGVNSDLITEKIYSNFKRSIEKMIYSNIIKSDKDNYGIMHADMHRGNLLLHNNEIRVIDFSFCKIGNFNWDLAIAISNMPPKLFNCFLEGYCSIRSLSRNYKNEIEAFFLVSVIGSISFLVQNRESRNWLENNLDRIFEYSEKYLRNEEFLFVLQEW